MARRKLPKIDLCRLRPERFRDMSDDQLMAVWARLGMSRPVHKKILGKIKGLVSNLAAAKSSQRTHSKDPIQQKRSWETYNGIATRIERDIWDLQAQAGCPIKGEELVARDADRAGQPNAARRLRKKAIIR